jgi:hypothetical protein
VAALGGGSLGSERIREALREHVVVHLDVDPADAWRRASGKGRPLARDRERFGELHEHRRGEYEGAADALLPAADRATLQQPLWRLRSQLGKLLAEHAALVEAASVVICNNSLPLHLADACRTALVVLYSGTEWESQWEPRASHSVLLRRPTPCQPCYLFECPIGLPCLDIDPSEVAEAALALLQPAGVAVGGDA